MSDYDGLIKRLQNAAMWADKGLVIPPSLVLQAADAIEKLVLRLDKANNSGVKTNWIPVTKQLPGNERVLIYSKDGGVSEGKYNHRDGKWTQYRWSVKNEYVTHWQPLPEPPTEKTDAL